MKIFPSLLSANFANLERDINPLVEEGVESFHLDIMDGNFVPNISFGPPVIRSLRSAYPQIELDAHLMVKDPLVVLEPILKIGVEWLSVHVEVEPPVQKIRRLCKKYDTGFGLVFNPSTKIKQAKDLLKLADFVLLMSVEPGFGGQSFKEETLAKVEILKKCFDGQIQMDGGLGPENVEKVVSAGVDWVVAGSSVFGQAVPTAGVRELLAAVDQPAP